MCDGDGGIVRYQLRYVCKLRLHKRLSVSIVAVSGAWFGNSHELGQECGAVVQ